MRGPWARPKAAPLQLAAEVDSVRACSAVLVAEESEWASAL
jgi:hypothetical protein